MKKRLAVILEEQEFKEIQRIALGRRITVAEWVRLALRNACRHEQLGDTCRKLDAVRAAALHSYPTTDIEAMLGEIDRGRVPAQRR